MLEHITFAQCDDLNLRLAVGATQLDFEALIQCAAGAATQGREHLQLTFFGTKGCYASG